jgi:uncharacterized metal-binding protein/predicted Fe-Mo cluster-binding NifX family protein
MRYGIPILGERVAPRSTYADSVLVAVLRRNHARTESRFDLADHSLLELAKVLSDNRIDVLVCGGISRDERDFLAARRMEIIDNVVGSIDELLAALDAGELRPGFGLDASRSDISGPKTKPHSSPQRERVSGSTTDTDTGKIVVDCLACRDRICLNGKQCDAFTRVHTPDLIDRPSAQMLEAAFDIAFENERTLCRLSELIYFCLEMRYQKIGLAYCIDLEEPTEILVRVLRRFFKVYPVCCKIGGNIMADTVTPLPSAQSQSTARQVACNPAGQADALNRIETDINVLVGLCMGADCLITRLSDAPVTTLFVKDKSLANNPIGAVYSDYYLKEAIQSTRGETRED